ncbi:MAG: hypothetical protein KDI79_20630 [Anaerolineae bacterium]|nr:hypothetical protein [Anaerolineae bacterium]
MSPVKKLIDIIRDDTAPGQIRIEAIEQLSDIWLQQKKQWIQAPTDRAIHLSTNFPGKEEILKVIRSQDRVDVRCQAAVLLANTDSDIALKLCNEILDLYL